MPTIPGPTTPAIVQRVQFLRDPIGLIESCGKAYGEVFALKLSKPGWIFLSNPSDVRELYSDGRDTYAAGAAKRGIFGKLLGDSSSLLLDGSAHRTRRKLLVPKFRGENMRAQSDAIRELTSRAVESWLSRGRINLHDELHALVRSAMLETIFGSRAPRSLYSALEEWANKAVGSKLLMFPALQVDLGAWSPWGRIERIKAIVDREVYAEIRRRRAESEQEDLLGCLLAAAGENGQRLTDHEIRDEVLTLVVAGHEITASVLSWLFYAIVSRPEVLAKVRRELAETNGRVDDLTYVDAVMRESMRYYSTIPNGSARIAKKPTSIRGYQIPSGALVTVALHLLHRRSEIFEHAHEFMPERFLGSKFAPFEYAPFGGGDRRCLGMAIAIHELKTIVATVLGRVDLVSELEIVRPVRRGAFVAPERGLPVKVHQVVQSHREANRQAG